MRLKLVKLVKTYSSLAFAVIFVSKWNRIMIYLNQTSQWKKWKICPNIPIKKKRKKRNRKSHVTHQSIALERNWLLIWIEINLIVVKRKQLVKVCLENRRNINNWFPLNWCKKKAENRFSGFRSVNDEMGKLKLDDVIDITLLKPYHPFIVILMAINLLNSIWWPPIDGFLF